MQNDQAWPKPYPIEELCKENECPPYTVLPLPQGEKQSTPLPPNTAAQKISGGIGGGGQRRGSIYWGGGLLYLVKPQISMGGQVSGFII